MNYNSILTDIKNIKELSTYDDEAAASAEHTLLYDFVDFIVSTFGDHDVSGNQHYLAVWATEIRKVKDMEFRRG